MSNNISSDFKPSNKLLNMWICLPQNSISILNNRVEPLFGNPKNFVLHYGLFILLIGLETYTIFALAHRGIDFKLMLVFVIAEIIIACVPQVIEWTKLDWCSAYINTELFVHQTKLRLLTKEHVKMGEDLVRAIRQYKKKLFRINLLKYGVYVIIVGFGVLKFMVYYDIYHARIWTNPAGRLILLTCVLGIITHLIATKIVLLDIMYRRKLKSEVNKFTKGDPEFRFDNNYKSYPIDLTLFPTTISLTKANDNGQFLVQEVEKDNISTKARGFQVDGQDRFVSNEDVISSNANFFYKNLLKDRELINLVMSQKDSVTKEIVALYGKEIQLSQL